LKGKAKSIEIIFYEMPTLLDEFTIKTIWPRSFVIREVSHNRVNFLSSEGILKLSQVSATAQE
jgi:hypothetical protein